MDITLISVFHWFPIYLPNEFQCDFAQNIHKRNRNVENTKFRWFLSHTTKKKQLSRLANATAAKNQLWPYLFEWVQVNWIQETKSALIQMIPKNLPLSFERRRVEKKKKKFPPLSASRYFDITYWAITQWTMCIDDILIVLTDDGMGDKWPKRM